MKFFLILLYFLRNEIQLNYRRLIIGYSFFKEISVFRYFIYLVNNSFIPCRNKVFRNYIHKNSQKWKNYNKCKNLNNKKYVLITGIFNHPGYLSGEALIGKNLMEIFNANGIALINYYDLKKILLYQSFGIKKIIILKNYNIFFRLKYFIKACLIIRSCKNMDEFLNYNINNIEIGKIVYDHYLRFSGIGTTNEFKREFYAHLSKSLLIYYQIDKYFKKYEIIASVQSEKQFLPGGIIFQTSLINNVNVYSRLGLGRVIIGSRFSVKKYSSINERYTSRDRFSNKLYDLINNNIKTRREAIELGGKFIKNRFEGLPDYQIRDEGVSYIEEFKKKNIINIEKKNIIKEDLCKRLEWKVNSPIGVIFATDLTDGVFDSTWSVFRDRLIWLRETLNEIKKIHNVNWLVKPHPNDEKHYVITSTESEYEKICSNCNNVKLFPNDINTGSLLEFIDATVTLNGSAASEYPCFGIPTIICCSSAVSGRGYTIECKSKEEYFFQLQNVGKLKKLNNKQIESAKIYIFIFNEFTQVPVNLLAYAADNLNEEIYWAKMSELLDLYNYEEDLLIKMMKIQERNNDLHTIDYRWIENSNKI